jgi:hypothetical protein
MRTYGLTWLGGECAQEADPEPAEREPAIAAA